MSVLVCGEALWDAFLKGEPEITATALDFDGRAGGSPFNVAIGTARLGMKSALFTGLSKDFLGERLAAVLRSEGVDDSRLIRKDELTTVSMVGLNDAGSAAYAFLGQGAADRSVRVAEIPSEVPEQMLHFGSYSIVTPPTADAFVALAAREKGRRLISLDPNIRPTVEPDMDMWRERVGALAAAATVIKISDEDIALLYPEAAPADVAARWLAGGVELVALTKGGEGAEAWTAAGHAAIQAPQAQVIDTVGAGDSFQAALLWALTKLDRAAPGAPAMDSDALARLLAFCAHCAAITVSRRGANPPRLDEVREAAERL